MFKEASLQAQKKQGEILLNTPTKIKVGNTTYKVGFMTKYANWRISGYLVGQKIADSSLATNIGLMKESEKLHCKAIACALLRKYWKIKLFEWIYWRIIMIRHTEKEGNELLSAIVEKMDVGFFFQTTKTVENLNSLMKKMTKTEAQLLFQAGWK